MDDFDLKKYLVENKVTTNSRIIKEEEDEFNLDTSRTSYGTNKKYTVDPQADADDFLDFIDTVNDYLMVSTDDLLDNPVDFDDIAALVDKYGKLLFEVEIVGLDPSADGLESYYSVTNQEVLNKIADIYAQEKEWTQLAANIRNGKARGFMTFLYDVVEDSVVVPLSPGFEEIETAIQAIT